MFSLLSAAGSAGGLYRRSTSLAFGRPAEAMRRRLCALLLFVCCSGIPGAVAQDYQWTGISLIDTLAYAAFGTGVSGFPAYPASHLFDGDFSTCRVTGTQKGQENPAVMVRLPETGTAVLNIFCGYGKSEALYYKNAAPRLLRLSFYAAVNPEGWVSEYTSHYHAVKFNRSLTVQAADSFGVSSVPIAALMDDLNEFSRNVFTQYGREFDHPPADSCLIVQIEILDIRPGTVSEDICISEIFFDDRYISPGSGAENRITAVYLNTEEDAVLLDRGDCGAVCAYQDSASILQLVEISENRRWAAVIAMPRETEGRAAAEYLLIDLMAGRNALPLLERQCGRNFFGGGFYFEQDGRERLFAVFYGGAAAYKIELK